MTIAQALRTATQRVAPIASAEARLECQLLLAHALRISRAHLLARLSDDLAPDAHAAFEVLVERRLAREPLAYITNHREFYGIDFECTPAALIPRPETELLVEIALSELVARPEARVVDVGTGTGAIAIAIAVNAHGTRATAIDASPQALTLARRNAQRAGVNDRIDLRSGNLLADGGAFDVVIANLPYISTRDWHALPPEIREYEPREALVGGEKGTELIERLLATVGAHLNRGGVLAAEIGDRQADRLLAVARECFPSASPCVIKDLAGLDRVLALRNEEG